MTTITPGSPGGCERRVTDEPAGFTGEKTELYAVLIELERLWDTRFVGSFTIHFGPDGEIAGEKNERWRPGQGNRRRGEQDPPNHLKKA